MLNNILKFVGIAWKGYIILLSVGCITNTLFNTYSTGLRSSDMVDHFMHETPAPCRHLVMIPTWWRHFIIIYDIEVCTIMMILRDDNEGNNILQLRFFSCVVLSTMTKFVFLLHYTSTWNLINWNYFHPSTNTHPWISILILILHS